MNEAARGLRHVKRAAQGDLHRFKAFIEMQEAETGAWRGQIEDGDVAAVPAVIPGAVLGGPRAPRRAAVGRRRGKTAS
jgi:hypothetical protein